MLIIRFRLAQIVILMMSLAIFFSYGLQFYVPIELLLPPLKARVSEQWQLTAEFVLRYSIVLFTCKLITELKITDTANKWIKNSDLIFFSSFLVALAAAIPKLDLFISLVGSISSSTLALMAPPIIHSLTYWSDLKSSKYGLLLILRNVFLFCLGFVGFIAGGFVSLSNIIEYFSGNGWNWKPQRTFIQSNVILNQRWTPKYIYCPCFRAYVFLDNTLLHVSRFWGNIWHQTNLYKESIVKMICYLNILRW